jgi:probable F420-dependent oxidoreductase
MDRIGWVVPNRYEGILRGYVDLVGRAETLGYRTAWTTEVAGADAVGLACAAAVHTERIRLGIGVLPVFTRTMPLIAMSAATLQSLSDGRAVLGLGTSTRNIVSHWHGQDFKHAITRLEETAAGVRAILAGKGRHIHGETVTSDGFSLAIQGIPEVPVHAAALGPKNLRSATRYADGVILTLCSAEGLRALTQSVRSSQRGSAIEITCIVRVAITDDQPAALDWMRRELAWYTGSAAYRAHFRRQGFEQQMAAAEHAWQEHDPEAARRAIDEDMCRELAAIGSPTEVKAQLEARVLSAGIDEAACYFMDVNGGGLTETKSQIELLASG